GGPPAGGASQHGPASRRRSFVRRPFVRRPFVRRSSLGPHVGLPPRWGLLLLSRVLLQLVLPRLVRLGTVRALRGRVRILRLSLPCPSPELPIVLPTRSAG